MATSAPLNTIDTRRDGGIGVWEGYAPAEDRPPLGSYATLSSGFAAAMGSFLVLRRRRGDLPERIEARDIVLLGTAAFKLSRLISREKVTAFVRAPFTEYQGKGDAPGEVEEKPRGRGLRGAVGQLLTCPYCIGMWLVSGLMVGLVTAPRETRLVASILSSLGLADFLQAAYRALVARLEP